MNTIIELIHKHSNYFPLVSHGRVFYGINLDLCDYTLRGNPMIGYYIKGGLDFSIISITYGKQSRIIIDKRNGIISLGGDTYKNSSLLEELSISDIDKLRQNLALMNEYGKLQELPDKIISIKCTGVKNYRLLEQSLRNKGYIKIKEDNYTMRGIIYVIIHKNGFYSSDIPSINQVDFNDKEFNII